MKKIVVTAVAGVLLFASCTGDYYSKGPDGVSVKTVSGETVLISPVSPKIIRVSASQTGKIAPRASLVVVPTDPFSDYSVSSADGVVTVSTASLQAHVRVSDGQVRFTDPDGNEILREKDGGGHTYSPIEVEGKKGWSVRSVFESPEDEAFYGLGQQQTGEFDHKGLDEELYQYNTKISVPFVVSSRGYGLLFDAYSLSRWGNPEAYRNIGEVFTVYDKYGEKGSLTGVYTAAGGDRVVRREEAIAYGNEEAVAGLPDIPFKGAVVTYEGFLEAREAGDYCFSQYYAGFQSTEIGGEEVMSRLWRPAWNPNSHRYKVHFDAGERKHIKVLWEPDGDVSYISLTVAPLQSSEDQARLSFWSEFEPGIDYYFIAGEDYDEVIKGYRHLTGKASLFPKWSLGFWQSRERYTTQDEIVGTLRELRRRHIPVDNIVQDWHYWLSDQWGSHEFDPERFPDPEKMLDDIHGMHGRFMISVWPKFYTNTDHYKELKEAGFMYTHPEDTGIVDWLGHGQSFYDAYAEGGRRMFWRQMDETLYSRYGRKIDAWWMDASEPNLRDCLPMDYLKWLLTPTALGPSTEYLNAYSLVNAAAIYEGQRSVDPDKRVFLLTRNGFAGLQRYGTASWSGDIGTSWYDMRKQMAAGLGYSMAGLPMWGMDIGGFSVMDKFSAAMTEFLSSGRVNEDLMEWRELQTRWHQFGTFVPLFRTHGQWPQRELWNIAPEGTETYRSILYYMRLRYRLMPYLYSLAGAVHFDDYTMMRGLPMDFPADPAVRDLSDQWMLGPALMPCPVYEYRARSRTVHFPAGAVWYDFYDGSVHEGGTDATVDAPYSRIPLYVRAGSIVPVGPDMEWSDEKAADPIRLFVYTGADGSFKFYEDDGLTFGYERGECSSITFCWNDASGQLTISSREGFFPGMLSSRTFIVVPVTPGRGFDPEAQGTAVEYTGSAVTLTPSN